MTGGIATGKSTVAAILSGRYGLPVLDADVYARQLLAPDTATSRIVLDRYGEQLRGPRGEVDRRALGRIIFAQPAERRWLEALIHPLVTQALAGELVEYAQAPTVVLVVPLLFEVGLEALCSEVWLVDLDEASQLKRLMARDQLDLHGARQRIRSQWPVERKRSLADVILKNHGDPEQLSRQVHMALTGSVP